MFRWSSFFTRLVILLLIAAAIWIGRDPLIQIAVTDIVQDTVGAKVEIGQIRSSFRDNKIFIKDIVIADPRDPMRNLFQAESAILELDRGELLRRRIRIVDGVSSQLVFGSPRLHSGAIAESKSTLTDFPTVSVALAHSDPYLSWLDRFQHTPSDPKIDELQLSKTAKEIFKNLADAIEKHNSQVANLKKTMRDIHTLVNFDDNPLRNEQRLKDAQQKLALLRNEIKSIGSALTTLDSEIAAHKTDLEKAKLSDFELFDRLSSQKQIDGETLTRLLLNKDLALQANQVIDLYLAFRDALPDPSADFNLDPDYGTDVFLEGHSSKPAFVIERMELDGEGRLVGNKYSFSGEARNISLDPYRYDKPVTFSLRAQGNAHFAINGVLDRTSGSMDDELTIQCPDLEMPSRQLGEDKSMLVQVSPCRSKIDIKLNCINNQISGKIYFDYDNLVMQIEHLDENAGGQAIAKEVNLDLASIANYRVHANISGSIRNPVIRFESDLGSQFAAKLNPIIGSISNIANHSIESEFNKYVSMLETNFGAQIQELAFQLENEIIGQQETVVAELQQKLDDGYYSRPNLRR